jgi:hypothetical protein
VWCNVTDSFIKMSERLSSLETLQIEDSGSFFQNVSYILGYFSFRIAGYFQETNNLSLGSLFEFGRLGFTLHNLL